MSPALEIVDRVAILTLGDDENRFSPLWLETVTGYLDRIEAGEASALVTTGDGKFYSNGLDLDWLGANGEQMQWYLDRVHGLFARVLTAGIPTVAAINGHAFGAGAMLAMAHDYRVMREDRGYICFPEIDIQIPFTPGMAALIQAKLSPASALEAMTTGRRYGGVDAKAAGLVTETAQEAALVAGAIARIAHLKDKSAPTLHAIKTTMYGPVSAALAPQS